MFVHFSSYWTVLLQASKHSRTASWVGFDKWIHPIDTLRLRPKSTDRYNYSKAFPFGKTMYLNISFIYAQTFWNFHSMHIVSVLCNYLYSFSAAWAQPNMSGYFSTFQLVLKLGDQSSSESKTFKRKQSIKLICMQPCNYLSTDLEIIGHTQRKQTIEVEVFIKSFGSLLLCIWIESQCGLQ